MSLAGGPVVRPPFFFGLSRKETMFSHGYKTTRNRNGFSLIELLIVVAIILIIAAIAIPNLLRAKIAANQSAAVGNLRTMMSAEDTFSSVYSDGFTLTLAQLGGPAGTAASCVNGMYVDEVLSTGAAPTKSGYTFTYTPSGTLFIQIAANVPPGCPGSGDTGFEISAVPLSPQTGTTSYCVDDTGVVRSDTTGAATANGIYPCPNAMKPIQ